MSGDPPQLGGHFDELIYLAVNAPASRLLQRLLWPSSRPLRVRTRGGAPQPRIREVDGVREYLWDAASEPIQMDASVPDWFDPWPAVELSDFADWGEVARWASPLFVPAPAAVEAIVAPWRALPEEERAARALAFAREQVRYSGWRWCSG